ncbi:hypothetical protein [Thermocatellispora tengchongensis]|uniref:hypothetical protein n=1 Tax=Thermocatellispora tengchongensis TaxID=1073253 RepID=UPI00362BD8B3
MTGTRDLRRAALWTLPAVALVGVLLAVALASWVAAPRWDAVAMGAGGWLLALVLRGPIAAAVAKLPRAEPRRSSEPPRGPARKWCGSCWS